MLGNSSLTITWQIVYGDQLDPSQHNQQVRDLALDEIQKFKTQYPFAKSNISFFEGIKKQLTVR